MNLKTMTIVVLFQLYRSYQNFLKPVFKTIMKVNTVAKENKEKYK